MPNTYETMEPKLPLFGKLSQADRRRIWQFEGRDSDELAVLIVHRERQLSDAIASTLELARILHSICDLSVNAPRDGVAVSLRFLPKTIKSWRESAVRAVERFQFTP